MSVNPKNIAAVLLILFSCRTPERPQASNLAAAVISPPVCPADRKFAGPQGFGFNFDAPRATMGDAYWMALASQLAYKPIGEAESMIKNLRDASIPLQLKFLSPGKELDSKLSANSFMVDFPEGDIVAFRGTSGIGDLATDADVTRNGEEVYLSGKELGSLKIHKGFWASVDERISAILWHYLSWQENVSYKVGSQEAFDAISRTIRGITLKADSETFDDTIGILKEFGLLVTEEYSERDFILSQIAIWKTLEIASAAEYASAMASASKDMKNFDKAIEVESAQKHKIAEKLHPFWLFKKYKPIWLTGHSLGGSQAVVTAFRLLKLGIPVKGIITFGAAQPGNEVFKALMESIFIQDGISQNFLRFVHGNDGPAILSGITGLSHIGFPVYIDDKQRFNFHREADNTSLGKMLAIYPGGKTAQYYDGNTPTSLPTVLSLDLNKMLDDHSMPEKYLKFIEQFVFGDPPLSCKP